MVNTPTHRKKKAAPLGREFNFFKKHREIQRNTLRMVRSCGGGGVGLWHGPSKINSISFSRVLYAGKPTG